MFDTVDTNYHATFQFKNVTADHAYTFSFYAKSGSLTQAGAQFGVSPGATDSLLDACEAQGLPMLPGAATASEAMRLLARGYDMLKFFPAEASGGAPALKAIGAPLPQISFCPTGGVSPDNANSYLSLSNVVCAGGSWVAPSKLVEAGDWDAIRDLARAASQLAR